MASNVFESVLEQLGILTPAQAEESANTSTTPTSDISQQRQMGVAPGSTYMPPGQMPQRPAAPQGSFFGMLDRFNNVPTQEQLTFQEAERRHQRDTAETRANNEAQNEIITAAARIRSENANLPPEQLIPLVVNSPEFQKNALRIPAEGMMKLMQGIISATQPPDPTRVQQPAGSGSIAVDPRTQVPIKGTDITTPPIHVSEWEYLKGQTPEDLQKIQQARAVLLRPLQDSDREQAFNALLTLKLVDPVDRAKFLAGTIERIATPRQDGSTHVMIIDKTDPRNTRILWDSAQGQQPGAVPPPPSVGQPTPPPGQPQPPAPPAQLPAPGTPPPPAPPAQGQPPAVQPPAPPAMGTPPTIQPPSMPFPPGQPVQPRGAMPGTPQQPLPPPTSPKDSDAPDDKKSLLQNPAGMFDAAGGLRGGVTWLGGVAGNFGHLSTYNQDMQAKRDALYKYAWTTQQMLKEGRELKDDLAAKQGLMPGLTDLGQNPHSTVQRAIGMHDFLMERRNRAERELMAANGDGSPRLRYGSAERGRRETKITEIDNILATLPTREQMVKQQEAYERDGVPNILKGLPPAGQTIDTGKGVIKDGKGALTPGATPPAQPGTGPINPTALQALDEKRFTDLFARMEEAGMNEETRRVFRQEAQRRLREKQKVLPGSK